MISSCHLVVVVVVIDVPAWCVLAAAPSSVQFGRGAVYPFSSFLLFLSRILYSSRPPGVQGPTLRKLKGKASPEIEAEGARKMRRRRDGRSCRETI